MEIETQSTPHVVQTPSVSYPLFAREKATPELFSEMMPLFRMHHREISHCSDIPLDPSFEHFLACEEAGKFRAFTARDERGRAVGYNSFVVNPHQLFKNSLHAFHDSLFIHPEARGFGHRFIKWCDEQLKREGVEMIYQHVSARHDYSPILKRQGYELIDYVYAKRIPKEDPAWLEPQQH